MLNYAEGLKYQREINGYTQSGLSKAIGISQQKISYYESGKHAPPIDDCIRLADFYGITLDELVGRDSKKAVHISDSFNNNSGNINFKA